MIGFVNAKINLGLNIIGKREDGYHLLETIMYPVGLNNGTPQNPEPFCDIMEIIVKMKRIKDLKFNDKVCGNDIKINYKFSGNKVDCPLEKNLVYKGVSAYVGKCRESDPEFFDDVESIEVLLDKHLPDGAGMGGGSADAVFAMKLLRDVLHNEGYVAIADEELEKLAASIGADCPFFVSNRPAFAEGIGEKLTPIGEVLKGKWLVVVKPDVSISTKEAYAGVTPRKPVCSLKEAVKRPLVEWRGLIHNDFEDSLFPKYPVLGELKAELYSNGAEYASLTGSGAALYGIYSSKAEAIAAQHHISSAYSSILLL